MTEWPGWTPTAGEHQRLGPLPAHVPGGPQNPMGARAIYLYANGKDTLFRIHGTNQPEYIGTAISSGCIRLTNEDVIDLYSRMKIGSPVVVLAPGHGDSPYSSQLALSQEFGHQTAQFNHQSASGDRWILRRRQRAAPAACRPHQQFNNRGNFTRSSTGSARRWRRRTYGPAAGSGAPAD
jgi:hypothetical protein